MSFLTCFWLLPAEGALQQVSAVTDACHGDVLPSGGLRSVLERAGEAPPRDPLDATRAPLSAVMRRRSACPAEPERPWSELGAGADPALGRPPADRPGSHQSVPYAGMLVLRLPSTWSTRPYSTACSAVRILSRSMSWRTCSDRAVRVPRQRLLEPGAHPQHLVGLDLDVGRLAVVAAGERRLVDQDPGVRAARAACPWCPRDEQHGRGGRRLPEADGLDVRA